MQPPKVWAAAVISVLDFFFVQHFDNPRGVPDRYGIVRHILRDHGGRAYDGVPPHAHTGQHRRACADPRIVPDLHRLAGQNVQIIGIVVVGKQLDVGGNAGMLANGDAAPRHCQQIGVDKNAPADLQHIQRRAAERRCNGAALAEILAQQLAEQGLQSSE